MTEIKIKDPIGFRFADNEKNISQIHERTSPILIFNFENFTTYECHISLLKYNHFIIFTNQMNMYI